MIYFCDFLSGLCAYDIRIRVITSEKCKIFLKIKKEKKDIVIYDAVHENYIIYIFISISFFLLLF